MAWGMRNPTCLWLNQAESFRSIIAHRYGVADIDYAKVWLALTDSIPKQIVPTVDELIKENENESKDE